MVVIPRDVLDTIFFMIAADPDEEASDRRKTILHVSYVCKWWRQVALEHSALWSCVIDYAGPLIQIQELLRRSGRSLLEFGGEDLVFSTDDEDYEVLQLVAEHAARLVTIDLRLVVDSEDDTDQLSTIIHSLYLELPLPHLKHLRLEAIRETDYTPNDDAPTFYNASVSSLLSSPNLRRVELRQWFFPLSPSSLGRLSCLQELEVREIKEPRVPTLQSWLRILASLPNLRWLVFDFAIIPNSLIDHSKPPPHTKVSLPKLEMITLVLPLTDSMQLLCALALPLKCGLKLDCDFSSVGLDQKTLLTLVQEKIEACQNNRQWCWSAGLDNDLHLVDFSNLSKLNSDDWSAETPPWRENLSMPPFPVLILRFGFEEDRSSDFMPFFHSLTSVIFRSSYPFTVRVQFPIHFGEAPEVSPMESVDVLAQNFHLLPKVESLELSSDVVPHVLYKLQSSTLPGDILFPALRSLGIHNTAILPKKALFSTTLIEFIKWRKRQGFPILSVGFHGCVIDKGYLDHFIGKIVELDMTNSFDLEELDL